MKRRGFLALFSAFATKCFASIQLGTSWAQSGPNITSESDGFASVIAIHLEYAANTVTVFYGYGTATNAAGATTAFTKGSLSPRIPVIFNLTNQTWQAPGLAQATMTAGEITALGNLLTNVFNAAGNPLELFAFNHNLFGTGTTNLPWTTGDHP